jgi:hypothetical protein
VSGPWWGAGVGGGCRGVGGTASPAHTHARTHHPYPAPPTLATRARRFDNFQFIELNAVTTAAKAAGGVVGDAVARCALEELPMAVAECRRIGLLPAPAAP